MSSEAIPGSISLLRGGPGFRWARRLFPRRREDRGVPVVPFVAVAWVPLAVLSFALGGLEMFLRDFAVHTRCLVAIPILLLAERVIDPRLNDAIQRLNEVIAASDQPRFAETIQRVQRARDALAPNLLIALLTLALAVALNLRQPTAATTAWWGHRGAINVAGWWYLVVSLPMYLFLLVRWVWWYALWVRVLRQVVRLTWAPIANHPDGAAGFGPVGTSLSSFSLVVLGVASTFAGSWAGDVEWRSTSVAHLGPSLLLLVVVMLCVFLGPALLFVPKLWRFRLDALARFDTVTGHVHRAFARRWFDNAQAEKLLDLGEVSSLTDLNSVWTVTHAMRAVPVAVRDVVVLVIAACGPMVLPLGMAFPLTELVKRVAGAVL